MDILKLYKQLLAEFGLQGWWPIFDIKAKECQYFYDHNFRNRGNYGREDYAFEICVGAILTQNTSWKNVERALANLLCLPFEASAKNGSLRGDVVPELVEGRRRRGNPVKPDFILSCKNLEQLIQPAGYYNQKARKLRIFSEWWQKNLVANWMRSHSKYYKNEVLKFRVELLNLWGIGKETADSMLLYAFNQPIFVIDTYTKRLCKEFGTEFKTYDKYREFFESQLPRDAQLFNEYHALIVAWGKLYTKNKEKALKILK